MLANIRKSINVSRIQMGIKVEPLIPNRASYTTDRDTQYRYAVSL